MQITFISMKSLPNNTPQDQITKMDSSLPGLGEILDASSGIGKEAAQCMAEQFQKAGMDGVANGSFVENTVHRNQSKYVKILRQRLIVEYHAQTMSERMLIDLAINAYFRSLHSAMIYNGFTMDEKGNTSFSQLRINMIKELGKNIELANRQFLSTLATLREIKRPPINIKVHSNQAFVAENQQFNKNA